MKLHVKIFPGAGLCDHGKKLELVLKSGSMNELLSQLEELLGVNPAKIEKLMFLHNGRGLDKYEDVVFQDEDQLWLLPQISGG